MHCIGQNPPWLWMERNLWYQIIRTSKIIGILSPIHLDFLPRHSSLWCSSLHLFRVRIRSSYLYDKTSVYWFLQFIKELVPICAIMNTRIYTRTSHCILNWNATKKKILNEWKNRLLVLPIMKEHILHMMMLIYT